MNNGKILRNALEKIAGADLQLPNEYYDIIDDALGLTQPAIPAQPIKVQEPTKTAFRI